MAMMDSIKKAALDVVVFSVSGMICMTGSFLVVKKLSPPAPATAAEGSGEKEKIPEKKKAPPASKAELEEDVGPVEGINYPLKSVIVNLADQEVRRFAKLTLTLQLKNDKVLKELEKKDPLVYDTLIKVLSRYKYTEVNSSNGKEILKEEVKTRLNLFLGEETITNVYLTELIIQ